MHVCIFICRCRVPMIWQLKQTPRSINLLETRFLCEHIHDTQQIQIIENQKHFHNQAKTEIVLLEMKFLCKHMHFYITMQIIKNQKHFHEQAKTEIDLLKRFLVVPRSQRTPVPQSEYHRDSYCELHVCLCVRIYVYIYIYIYVHIMDTC